MHPRGTAPVSVVIPCFRCGDTVERALLSVAEQTVRPSEVIVVDDGSDDETPAFLEALRLAHGGEWVKVIRLPANMGPGAARNAGWDAATQPYVAFLDADDMWHPRKVEIQLEVMESNPDLVFSGHRWCWTRGELRPDFTVPRRIKVSRLSLRTLLLSNVLSTPTVMIRRNVLFRFPTDKKHSEDYLLWLKLLFAKCKAGFIHADLTYLGKPPYGAGGLSGQLWKMEIGELDTYQRLYHEGLVPLPIFAVLCLWSLAKFIRRVLVVSFSYNAS